MLYCFIVVLIVDIVFIVIIWSFLTWITLCDAFTQCYSHNIVWCIVLCIHTSISLLCSADAPVAAAAGPLGPPGPSPARPSAAAAKWQWKSQETILKEKVFFKKMTRELRLCTVSGFGNALKCTKCTRCSCAPGALLNARQNPNLFKSAQQKIKVCT
jgi:hypothetical protein